MKNNDDIISVDDNIKKRKKKKKRNDGDIYSEFVIIFSCIALSDYYSMDFVFFLLHEIQLEMRK